MGKSLLFMLLEGYVFNAGTESASMAPLKIVTIHAARRLRL